MKFVNLGLFCAALAGCLLQGEGAHAQATKPAPANEIVGSWRQLSATYGGKPAERANGVTTLMHVTTTQFTILGISKDQITVLVVGGTVAEVNDEFRETVVYTSGNVEKLKGQTFVYHSKFDGARLTLSGTMNNVEGVEVWERIASE